MHSFAHQDFSTHGSTVGFSQAVVEFIGQTFVYDKIEVRAFGLGVLVNRPVQADLRGLVFIKKKGILLFVAPWFKEFIEDRYLWLG